MTRVRAAIASLLLVLGVGAALYARRDQLVARPLAPGWTRITAELEDTGDHWTIEASGRRVARYVGLHAWGRSLRLAPDGAFAGSDGYVYDVERQRTSDLPAIRGWQLVGDVWFAGTGVARYALARVTERGAPREAIAVYALPDLSLVGLVTGPELDGFVVDVPPAGVACVSGMHVVMIELPSLVAYDAGSLAHAPSSAPRSDGTRLVFASSDVPDHLVIAEIGSMEETTVAIPGVTGIAALAADGSRVAALTVDATHIHIHSLANGLWRFDVPRGPVAFTREGGTVWIDHDEFERAIIRLGDPDGTMRTLEDPIGVAEPFAFATAPGRLVIGAEGSLAVLDLATGDLVVPGSSYVPAYDRGIERWEGDSIDNSRTRFDAVSGAMTMVVSSLADLPPVVPAPGEPPPAGPPEGPRPFERDGATLVFHHPTLPPEGLQIALRSSYAQWAATPSRRYVVADVPEGLVILSLPDGTREASVSLAGRVEGGVAHITTTRDGSEAALMVQQCNGPIDAACDTTLVRVRVPSGEIVEVIAVGEYADASILYSPRGDVIALGTAWGLTMVPLGGSRAATHPGE